jgi:hypothetical protein
VGQLATAVTGWQLIGQGLVAWEENVQLLCTAAA